jgi:hypothetical protein
VEPNTQKIADNTQKNADRSQKAADKVENAAWSAADHAHDTLANVNTTVIKAIDQNRAIAQTLMRAMHEESLRFMNMRLEHTTRAFERSRECQGISAFLSLQQDWFLDVARDYAELNKRFSDVLHDVTEQSVNGATDVVAEAVRNQKRETNGSRAAA